MKKSGIMPIVLLLVGALIVAGCTGPADENGEQGEVVLGAGDAVDIAVGWLQDEYPDEAPGSGVTWTVEDIELTAPGGEPVVGASAKQFLSDDWIAMVDWPVVAPEHLQYQIVLRSPSLGWYWEGSVQGVGGEVTEEIHLQQMTEEMARTLAEQFVMDSATYQYDGMEGTFEFVETREASGDYAWTFVFSFDSRQTGYGDRTGQVVAQAITSHTAVVTVSAMDIESAVLDGQWDMQAQEPVATLEEARETAEEFVRNSPTFQFDGIGDTLELVETGGVATGVVTPEIEEIGPAEGWVFTFAFDSRHPGYGDRSGEVLAQVITPHLAVVTVIEGEVASGIMDGRWNMLEQQVMLTEEAARQTAEDFVRNSPTFRFDGMPETLELIETLYPDIENAWGFVYSFESRHAGYGDRTGEDLAQVITPHEAHVTVQNGEVMSALMDEQWDMLAQEMV